MFITSEAEGRLLSDGTGARQQHESAVMTVVTATLAGLASYLKAA